MTKAELKVYLLGGATLSEVLPLREGQDCTIFKADDFCTDDSIIYIPDIDLNEIPDNLDLSVDNSMSDASAGKWYSMSAKEQISLVLSYCYTGADFVELCEFDEALAYQLFLYVDWQHPSSALGEVAYEDEDDVQYVKRAFKHWRKKHQK